VTTRGGPAAASACVGAVADGQYCACQVWAGAGCRARRMRRLGKRTNARSGGREHASHEKSVGIAHLIWAVFERPERPARAAARVEVAALAWEITTAPVGAMAAPSEVPERRWEDDIRVRLAGLEGGFGVVRASRSAPLASEEAAGRRKKWQAGPPHDGGPACDRQSVIVCEDGQPVNCSAAVRVVHQSC
jgi:hypothetical protein